MVYVMKYFDPKDTGNSWDNGQDFYVVRCAEVLLSLAEALVQKGGYDESEVIGLVNQVRQRADVNMPTVEAVEGTCYYLDATEAMTPVVDFQKGRHGEASEE